MEAQKGGANIDSLVLFDLPKGIAGKKGGVSKRGRRGKRRANTGFVESSDRVVALTDGSSSTILPINSISTSGYCHTISNQVVVTNPLPSPLPSSFQDSTPYFTNLSPQHYSPISSMDATYLPHGIQPYHLKILTKQIKVCAGCRFGFNNAINLPEPPYNMCIAHEESFQVSIPKFTTKTVAHYHANPSCIWKNDACFIPHLLEIPPLVEIKLKQANKQYLTQFFGKKFS